MARGPKRAPVCVQRTCDRMAMRRGRTRSVTDGGVKGGADDANIECGIRISQTADVWEMCEGGNAGETPLLVVMVSCWDE